MVNKPASHLLLGVREAGAVCTHTLRAEKRRVHGEEQERKATKMDGRRVGEKMWQLRRLL